MEQVSPLAILWVRLRWVWLALCALITFYLGGLALQIQFNFSPDSVFSAKDPSYRFFVDRLLPNFSEKSSPSIVAIAGSIDQKNVQEALVDLHRTLEKTQGIDDVQSLVNASVFEEEGGILKPLPLFEKGKLNYKRLEIYLSSPVYPEFFISKDKNTVAVVVRSDANYQQQHKNETIARSLKTLLGEVKTRHPELTFYLTGNPSIQEEAISTLKRDQFRFLPFVLLLMALVLWLSFHHIRGVLLPFLTTLIATIWAIGWLVLREHPLDIVNNSMVVLILVIGIADALHILARFEDELKAAQLRLKEKQVAFSKLEVVAKTVQHMALPCFLTTATTALGFASSITAGVEIVRQFGLDAAVGVMGSYISTMLLVPSFLMILPLPNLDKKKLQIMHFFPIDFILTRITQFSILHAKPILILGLFLGVFSFTKAKDIESNQTLVSELPSEAPPVLALDFIQKNLGGIIGFDVVYEGSPDRLKEPEFLQKTAHIQNLISKTSLHPQIHAFQDILRGTAYALNPHQPIPSLDTWNEEKIAQTLLLLELSGDEEVFQGFYNQAGDLFRMNLVIHNNSTRKIAHLREEIMGILKNNPVEGATSHLTGGAMIATQALNNTLMNLASSLGLAVVMIWLLVLGLFRSFRFSIIVLLPNLLPILLTLAVMKMADIDLRVATILIFSMVLGIAVDTCIHLIARLREEMQASKDSMELILERTIRGSGRPIVYSTFLLLIGFSVLSLSSFQALRDFSILSCVTLAIALLVDFLLLPALVLIVNPKVKG